MKKNISDHITYAEATYSKYAIDHDMNNSPNEEELENMKCVANNVFEPLRKFFETSIAISSFFRSKELNRKIGGVATSQHMTGEAMDIDAQVYGGITNNQIFQYIKNNLKFDQCIAEYPDENNEPAWVHVSYKKTGNRQQTLISKKENGKTVYEKIA